MTFQVAAEEAKRIEAELISMDWAAIGEGRGSSPRPSACSRPLLR